jgi:hypothetical protein
MYSGYRSRQFGPGPVVLAPIEVLKIRDRMKP